MRKKGWKKRERTKVEEKERGRERVRDERVLMSE